MKPITNWISTTDLAATPTSAFWNDIAIEKTKDWWIADGNHDKCLAYLRNSGLLAEYDQAEREIISFAERHSHGLIVADLAAGIGWTSARLSRLPSVDEVIAVELSYHRLDRLFEEAVKMMDGVPEKISRYHGSFYDLRVPEGSVDLILMSQAFHHADNPVRLLDQCDRALAPGGRIVITGEHYISPLHRLRTFLSLLIKKQSIRSFHEAYVPDPVMGDHYYRISDYYFMFRMMGYRLSHQFSGADRVIYVADKPGQAG